jgi:hypothetical protein
LGKKWWQVMDSNERIYKIASRRGGRDGQKKIFVREKSSNHYHSLRQFDLFRRRFLRLQIRMPASFLSVLGTTEKFVAYPPRLNRMKND